MAAALDKAAAKGKSKWMRKDPIFPLSIDLLNWYRTDVLGPMRSVEASLEGLHREYMEAQRTVFEG